MDCRWLRIESLTSISEGGHSLTQSYHAIEDFTSSHTCTVSQLSTHILHQGATQAPMHRVIPHLEVHMGYWGGFLEEEAQQETGILK